MPDIPAPRMRSNGAGNNLALTRPDPRTHAYRDDLADARLAGKVAAARYVTPWQQTVLPPHIALRDRPDAAATAVSELLAGEAFAVLDHHHGWAWGYGLHDGYVGYVESAALGPALLAPTHRIIAATALVFKDTSIKSPVLGELPLGARVAATAVQGQFVAAAGGWLHTRHAAPLARSFASDPLAVAHEFLGTPYRWGGRTRAGIDCSGLIQTALTACGLSCPRDSDQQRAELGTAVDTPRRGDIVFFPGHVGIMASDSALLHANAYWMNTVIEPLAHVIDRLRPEHDSPVLAIKRL